MKRLALAFCLIALYKVLRNLIFLIRCRRFQGLYREYLANQTWDMAQHQDAIIGIFVSAGIKDSVVPTLTPMGFGQAVTANVSVFQNLMNTETAVPGLITKNFHRAAGVFKSRIYETFSPIFWIEYILRLPRHLFSYVGLSPESAVSKLVQLAYWIVSGLLAILYSLYRPEVDNFIRSRIGSWMH